MKSVKIMGAVGMLVGICCSGGAATLLPGADGLDPTQAPSANPPLAVEVVPYSFGPLSGTVTSWVTTDPANPLGGLSFYYQINNTGTEEVSRLSVADFGIGGPGSLVEVSTVTAPYFGSIPGGVLPGIATRSTGNGDVVGFDFSGVGEINGGQNSTILVVNTAYHNFINTPDSIIDNNSYNLSLFGPAPAQTPEASSLMAASLLLIPLGASMLRIMRKNQAV